ncbi:MULTISPECIES: YihY/virulence factor BrkB family protein [unclassified Streptococcus]|uniref:YihY/virulence factor BrkB family protein n=1 Tax=unclassified Streptococcus TaxID=2608887 RepID=UPI00142FD444|nr:MULTISPECIES: YihY/virulence factor BrkB family protein [unclassified Streptococcus]MBF0806600.1 YihY/virulence factor BrkB family protein [Streptococcus sp. 19428wA2_WM07]
MMEKLKGRLATFSKNPLVSALGKFYSQADSQVMSIAIAYYLMLSLIPFFLILANLLPYLPVSTSDILSYLEVWLPESLYPTISQLVEGVLSKPSTGFWSLALLSAFWTLSSSMWMVEQSFNKVYGVEKRTNYVASRILSLAMGVLLQLVILSLSFLSLFSSYLLEQMKIWLEMDTFPLEEFLKGLSGWSMVPLVFLLFFLYYSLPNVAIKKIGYTLPGILLVTIVLYLFNGFINLYLIRYMGRFTDYRLVGSVALFAVIFWFILIARVLIIGAVLNASYQFVKEGEFDSKTYLS